MPDVEVNLPAQARGTALRRANHFGIRINAMDVTRQARDPPRQSSITAPDLEDSGAGEGGALEEATDF